MESIAQRLAWETVALNELPSSQAQRTALEVAYGVACIIGDQPELFSAMMSSIIQQITDETTKGFLRQYTGRGVIYGKAP